MENLGVFDLLAMAGFCVSAAFLVLWALSFTLARADLRRVVAADPVAFLLDGDDIVEQTDAGARLLAEIGPASRRRWALLHRGFSFRFPAMPQTAEEARARAPLSLAAADPADPARLALDLSGALLRVELDDPGPATAVDRHLRQRHFNQLDIVEKVIDVYPYPVWLRSGTDGQMFWNNKAFRELLDRVAEDPERPEIPDFDFAPGPDETSHSERRLVQDRSTDRPHWYNITHTRTDGGDILGYAIGIDTVVEAELAQRKFVQTLTKTFAQLNTGLAIFDRERQLALFNPALIDLLALPAEFLSARPTLLTFFDRLRDNRMMPEPKNYANWRHQITDLVIASVDGRYQETWTLPSGLTYRVSGRPHPDGAVALLFEDISAEVSLTRRFRSQLNLDQAVLDSLDEAIAVFSAGGTLTLSNRAFATLWKMDPGTSFAEVTIRDALTQWQSLTEKSPFWSRLHDCLVDPVERTEWFADVRMKTGARLECRVTPVAGGATLIGFRLRPMLETAAGPVGHGRS